MANFTRCQYIHIIDTDHSFLLSEMFSMEYHSLNICPISDLQHLEIGISLCCNVWDGSWAGSCRIHPFGFVVVCFYNHPCALMSDPDLESTVGCIRRSAQ